MELKYVVLTIIKILISVPGILLYHQVDGIVLMGGHMDNQNITTNSTNLSNHTTIFNSSIIETTQESEEIPDPSPLVLPGYNLPENIFNKGKPFYLEKDPLTGEVDFDTKNPSVKLDDDLYDYTNDEDDVNYKDNQSTSFNIYDKVNIDRKDGSLNGHQPSDINQLTPNFHDFLNLPVKYNSDKYVYPLISSSYANTKIQGNVNKYHNHKDYHEKYSTSKTTVSPTYYFDNVNKIETKPTTTTSTTTTTTTTTTRKPTTQIYFTTNGMNLMNSGMNHPSFHEDFEYYDYDETTKPDDGRFTTKSVDKIYLTTITPSVKTTISTTTPTTTTTTKVSTTTKKVMSLFEQLFGDYEDMTSTTEKSPQLFENLPNNKNKQNEINTVKPLTTTTTTTTPTTTTTIKNVLTESHMSLTPETLSNSYDYEDYVDDNIAVENQPVIITANSTKTTTTTTTTPRPTTTTTTPTRSTMKVTSLPLGENHIGSLNNNQPIIVATQNLREKLNSERVSERPQLLPPKTSNIHIAPNQDTVSFVVGHYQNVDGTPSINQNNFHPTIDYQQQPQSFLTNTITIQPQKNSEASLSIGVPIDTLQQKPGQVVDDQLEITTGSKIIFPDDKEIETDNLPPSLLVPPSPPPNREILQLNSKPMYHQLPSDLTPPKEQDALPLPPPPPTILDRPRPPWDPRPGHFFSGKPEYVRPPRPPLPPPPLPTSQDLQFKRIDNLPNILPQFRPNMKPHYLNRQPLLERPSNRPVGFFEKLQPPPPPPKNLHNLRKIPPPQNLDYQPPKDTLLPDQMNLYKSPPKIMIANRRIGNLEGDVETLQMIQAKKIEKTTTTTPPEIVSEIIKNGTEKPLYVVYPVNTPPIKMDVIDTNKKETVVIGTRAELPLPPSKIQSDFNFQKPNRNDAPILKPHNHHHTFPMKSDFPYPLERPDPSVLNPAVPETPQNHLDDADYIAGNHWNTIGENLESRIVNNGKLPSANQISVTLKTFTDKPIAVAYTPTQPNHYDKYDFDKYSMPNYANPVIPEIRPGTVENVDLNRKKQENEFTVSAIMHTHPQSDVHHQQQHHHHQHQQQPQKQQYFSNHRIDTEESSSVHPLDFQAPFQASVSIDSPSSGWSVVRDKNKSTTEEAEVTTIPLASTSEFDIENFKPQLEGGFKPIYNLPTEDLNKNDKSVTISEREE